MDLTINTQVPEYVLDDYINLTGNYSTTKGSWVENTTQQFNGGHTYNLTVQNDAIQLVPGLDIAQLNSGYPVMRPGTGSDWDLVLVKQAAVKVGGKYYMYYGGARSSAFSANWSIGLATSNDGISWTKYSKNPVLESRKVAYEDISNCCPVLWVEGGKWHMWYSGNQGTSTQKDENICYANSTDGYSWTRHPDNPVIMNNANNNAWDGTDLRLGGVVKEGNRYTLFYLGDNGVAGFGSPKLGSANSTDGSNWTKNPSNPLSRTSAGWEGSSLFYSTAEAANGTYRVWFSTIGGPGMEVGYVHSSDGVNWDTSSSAVISPETGTIYDKNILWPTVIDEGDHYLMLAHCHEWPDTRTIGAFKLTPTMLNGTYASTVKDLGAILRFENATWNGSEPNGTMHGVHIRYGNSTRNLSPWRLLDGGGEVNGVKARYVQYRVEFRAYKDWQKGLAFDSFRLNYTIPLASVEYSVDGTPWQSGTPVDPNGWYANATLHDGDYDIRIRVTDATGGSVTKTVAIKCDLYPPTGNITIEHGKWFHNSTLVHLTIRARDTHPPIEMQVSRQPDFAGATWGPLITDEDWQILGNPEGVVTIYVRFRDDAGRVSDTYNDSVFIDTSSPIGTLLIDEGAKYTKDRNVTLNVTWTDLSGVVSMMVSNDPTFEGASWMDPVHLMAWQLEDAEGVRHVYVRLLDVVGWSADINDSIILDRTVPAATLSINNDAPFTASRDVTLDVTLHDVNPVRVKIANTGDQWPETWTDLTSPIEVPWTLASGEDGPRAVRMLVRDAAGNEVEVSDDIVLDTTPPEGSLVLDGGAQYTTDVIVTATLQASDATSGFGSMRVSNSSDFTGASWQSVKETFEWVLDPGDGQKLVFVQLRDRAGLTVTLDAAIILDTTPPEGTFYIEDGAEYVGDTKVELDLAFTDNLDLDQVRVSDEAGFEGADWQQYSSLLTFELTAVEGGFTLYMEVSDAAGNTFLTSASAILDLTDPTVSVEVRMGGEATLSRDIAFTWSAADPNGLDAYTAALNQIGPDAVWIPLDGVESVEDAAGTLHFDGDADEPVEVQVIVRVRDLAGRTTTAHDSITFVPGVPRVHTELNDGANLTNDSRVRVRVHLLYGFGEVRYRSATAIEDLNVTELTAIDQVAIVKLEGSDGEKWVYHEVMDGYGFSTLTMDRILLDTTPPMIIASPPPANRTENGTTLLDVTVTDAQDPNPAVRWRVNGGEWREYSSAVEVDLVEGDNLIEVEATDAAGNTARASWWSARVVTPEVSSFPWWALVLILVFLAAVLVAYVLLKKREVERGDT